MADSNWEVTYPDNKTLNAKLQMGSLAGGPEGGLGVDALIGKMYALKLQAQRDADNRAARLARENQIATGMGSTKTPYVPEQMPFRDMMQAKSMLERDYIPSRQAYNQNFMFLPSAAALTRNNLGPSGWDTLAKLEGAAGGTPPNQPQQDPLAKPQAESMDRNNTYLNAMRMYRPEEYQKMMTPKQQGGS